MGVVCRFMTHPPTLCASCMGQGEIGLAFNTGRKCSRRGEVAGDGAHENSDWTTGRNQHHHH
jgi:hypothetical protein